MKEVMMNMSNFSLNPTIPHQSKGIVHSSSLHSGANSAGDDRILRSMTKENGDMNAIKQKYNHQTTYIQPFIHTMKRGIVERANAKTGGCNSCGR